jgi:hypothetical protein
MRSAQGRKIANPIEPYTCNKCDGVGMRYQGTRNRSGVEISFYRCVHCLKTMQDPEKYRPIMKRDDLDALIREHYPEGDKDELIAMSGVTWNVIRNRARTLGINRVKMYSTANGIGAKLEYHAAHVDGRMIPMPLDYFSKLVKHQRAWA